LRMPGDLQGEVAVPAFKQQLASRRTPYRETAKDERPGGETERLAGGIALFANQTDAFRLLQLLFRDNEFAEVAGKKLPCRRQSSPALPRSAHSPAPKQQKSKNEPKLVTFLVTIERFGGFWEGRPEWPKVLKLNQLGVGCGGKI
jgi:hypothetical protein